MNGALPPSSSPTFFTVPAVRHQQLADVGRTGEGDHPHARMLGRRLTNGTRFAGHDVEYSRGHAGRRASSPSASAATASLGGFGHDGAADGERRATLRVIIAAGKFHGVIAATTPIGC